MNSPEVQVPDGSRAPSPWVVDHSPLIPRNGRNGPNSGGNVLDLACGKGRHTRYFLALGYRITAVDRDVSGLADIARKPGLEIIETDLEAPEGAWPLGDRMFSGVVVTNYLWRPLMANIVAAVAPGGVLIYETFAQGNERFGRPRNPDHLLRPGELRDLVKGELEVIEYRHGEIQKPRPAVTQSLCARRNP